MWEPLSLILTTTSARAWFASGVSRVQDASWDLLVMIVALVMVYYSWSTTTVCWLNKKIVDRLLIKNAMPPQLSHNLRHCLTYPLILLRDIVPFWQILHLSQKWSESNLILLSVFVTVKNARITFRWICISQAWCWIDDLIARKTLGPCAKCYPPRARVSLY